MSPSEPADFTYTRVDRFRSPNSCSCSSRIRRRLSGSGSPSTAPASCRGFLAEGPGDAAEVVDRSALLSAEGKKLFLAWEDDGRDEDFLDPEGPGVVVRLGVPVALNEARRWGAGWAAGLFVLVLE